MKRRAATWLAAGLVLAGCATAPPPGAAPPGALRAGRLVVKVAEGDQGSRSHSAAFELQGDETTGRLRLLGPLGTQVAQAEWGPQGVQLDDGQGRRHFPDLTTLAREALGEPLPLAALLHWLAGRPWPGAPHEPSAQGFVQLGWAVDLSRWADAATLQAERLDPPGVSVRARLDPAP
ncbi:lipoprotein insertase outer membrane protein LolB [Ideonella sp.]|uniref:lipoprotein insertase outer membrane protein LolB n=1 Tax=Ideonella sp. TaxID=1929293 RepID=UPI0035B20F13